MSDASFVSEVSLKRCRLCWLTTENTGIDSQPGGGSVRQPCWSYRPARLIWLAESIPRNRFLGSLKFHKNLIHVSEKAAFDDDLTLVKKVVIQFDLLVKDEELKTFVHNTKL